MLAVALLVTPAFAADTFPPPKEYVNDFAAVIPADTKAALERSLADFDKKTTVQIAVVTVADLGGDSVDDYAVRLFEAWGIGRKGADNGILLLASRDDRKIKIEVGYGMEPYLTDGRAGRILDEQVVPALKAGNYGKGLSDGAKAIQAAVIANGYEPGTTRPAPIADTDNPKLYIVLSLAFASMYIMSYMARTKEVVLGALWGAGLGGVIGWLFGGLIVILIGAGIAAVLGLVLDIVLSHAYKYQVSTGRPTSFGSTWGGFYGGNRWGGGGSGGGFGGFGGGQSGGGGAGRGF